MHVAGTEEKKCIQVFGAGKKLKTKDSLEDLGADGRNIVVFCSSPGWLLYSGRHNRSLCSNDVTPHPQSENAENENYSL